MMRKDRDREREVVGGSRVEENGRMSLYDRVTEVESLEWNDLSFLFPPPSLHPSIQLIEMRHNYSS